MFCLSTAQIAVPFSSLRGTSSRGFTGRRTKYTESDASLDAVARRALADGGALAALVHALPAASTLRGASVLSPWWRTSYRSHESFLENNLRMRPAEMILVRGFKSKRYSGDGASPIGRVDRRSADVDHDGAREPDEMSLDLKRILEKVEAMDPHARKALEDAVNQKHLSATDARIAAASIAGYNAGQGSWRDQSSGESGAAKNFVLVGRGFVYVSVMLALAFLVMNSMGIIRMKQSNMTKAIAPEDINVTFEDVKGCDEAKEELQDLVDFLTAPEKFSNLGGKLPKGCLLVGPPGTGKTLLAKAVAGEAGVPFFHANGSEFEEMFVGTGAKRVRDLFYMAKRQAPCVVFIDEIDSVGSKRTNSPHHPFANQTINQLLSEMDGFVSNEGVIVLAATNRDDQLDQALLRPGRFDTKVHVIKPDLKGRRDILRLYLGNIVHDSSVDIEKLAKMTVDFSGADLENLVNTSAIRAAIENKETVSMSEFEYAFDKHTLGVEWKSRERPKDTSKIVAYHEAGHTLVGFFTEDADPVYKVTIVAKGQSGGHTAFLPDSDSTLMLTKAQMVARMDTAMGGRAAEEIIFGVDKITGGAYSDLQNATMVAEQMTKHLGMSDKVGLRFLPDEGLSEAANKTVDEEVSLALDSSYKRAKQILTSHRRELDNLAQALIKYETLDKEDIEAIVKGNVKQVDAKKAAEAKAAAAKAAAAVPVVPSPPTPKKKKEAPVPVRPSEVLT